MYPVTAENGEAELRPIRSCASVAWCGLVSPMVWLLHKEREDLRTGHSMHHRLGGTENERRIVSCRVVVRVQSHPGDFGPQNHINIYCTNKRVEATFVGHTSSYLSKTHSIQSKVCTDAFSGPMLKISFVGRRPSSGRLKDFPRRG